jgi:hypothetical protein
MASSLPGRHIRLPAVVLPVVAGLALTPCTMQMPGTRHTGPLPLLTPEQSRLTESLRADVQTLAGEIGDRNVQRPERLAAAADFIEASLVATGFRPLRQTYNIQDVPCSNIEAQLTGSQLPEEIVVVGAHYDSIPGCPAANDNASGVAATLALARAFAARPQQRTIRFLFFVNEEPPFVWTDEMGSLVYAKACRERGDKVVGMLSLETIGCYSDQEGSQRYPPLLDRRYPSTGDFIGFVGMSEAGEFVRRCVGAFRDSAEFPSEGAAVPAIVPMAAASDHWSFWRAGYPALMVTDTAPFRYPHYHEATDTPEKLDYERMARVVGGLEGVVRRLAND